MLRLFRALKDAFLFDCYIASQHWRAGITFDQFKAKPTNNGERE